MRILDHDEGRSMRGDILEQAMQDAGKTSPSRRRIKPRRFIFKIASAQKVVHECREFRKFGTESFESRQDNLAKSALFFVGCDPE